MSQTFNIHNRFFSDESTSTEDELGLKTNLQGSNDDSDSYELQLPSILSSPTPIDIVEVKIPIVVPSQKTNDEFLSLIEKQKTEAGEKLTSKPLEAPNYVRPYPYKTSNFHKVEKMKKGSHQVFYQTPLSKSSPDEETQQKNKIPSKVKHQISSSSEEDINISLKGKKHKSYSSSSSEDMPYLKEKKKLSLPSPKKETITTTTSKNIELNNTPFLKSSQNQLVIKSLKKDGINDSNIYESSNLGDAFKPKKNIESSSNKEAIISELKDINDYYLAYLKDDCKDSLLKTDLNWHCTIRGITKPRHKKLKNIHKFIPVDKLTVATINETLVEEDIKKTRLTDNVSIIVAEKIIADKKAFRYWLDFKKLLDKKETVVMDYEANTVYGGHVRVYYLANSVLMSQFFDKNGHSKVIDLVFTHPTTGKIISNLFVFQQMKPFGDESYNYFIHLEDGDVPTMIISFFEEKSLYQLWVFYGIPLGSDLESKSLTSKKTNSIKEDPFHQFLLQL